MVIFVLLIALLSWVVLSDVITLRDVFASDMTSSMKMFWSAVVLLVPIVGMSVYFFTKNSRCECVKNEE